LNWNWTGWNCLVKSEIRASKREQRARDQVMQWNQLTDSYDIWIENITGNLSWVRRKQKIDLCYLLNESLPDVHQVVMASTRHKQPFTNQNKAEWNYKLRNTNRYAKITFALLATRFTDFVGLLVDCFLNYPRSLARERAAQTTPLCTP
jgi:hypothetical protein